MIINDRKINFIILNKNIKFMKDLKNALWINYNQKIEINEIKKKKLNIN